MAAILSILIGTEITDGKLVSSSIAENDYPVWNSATIYGLGDRCIKGHRIYESQVAADATTKNQNKDPANLDNQFGAIVFWLDVNPTNRYAMFDGYVSTQTEGVGSITVVLLAGAFNEIYLDGLQAQDLEITIKDKPGGTVVYHLDTSLRGSRPSTYWQYYFNPFTTVKSKVIFGVPPYSNMELTLKLSAGAEAPVRCGMLAVGMTQRLGQTQQGVKVKPTNYGYTKVDQFGKATYKPGKKARDLSASALIDAGEMRQVQDILTSAIGVPCKVSCSDSEQYSGTNVWGFLSGEVLYRNPTTSEVSINQEGLI